MQIPRECLLTYFLRFCSRYYFFKFFNISWKNRVWGETQRKFSLLKNPVKRIFEGDLSQILPWFLDSVWENVFISNLNRNRERNFDWIEEENLFLVFISLDYFINPKKLFKWHGVVAKWLRHGSAKAWSPVRIRATPPSSPDGGTGRHTGLKILCP